MKDNSEELFPIVDEDGNITGAATRGECHGGSKLLHPVVHLHVFNSKGELYLQKRPEWKDIQPGKWDTAVGGHVDLGECIEDALYSRVFANVNWCLFTRPSMMVRLFLLMNSMAVVSGHLLKSKKTSERAFLRLTSRVN